MTTSFTCKRRGAPRFIKENSCRLQIIQLRLDCLGIGELDHADRKVFEFRQFRCSEATCPGYNFVLAFLQFAY